MREAILLRVLFFVLSFILFSDLTWARVFGLKQQKFASYFLISASQPPVNDSPWVLESTADASSKSYTTITGGEFGFTYATAVLSWRFGFEIIKPSKLSEISATQAGAEVYQVASDITGYAPKIGLEYSPWVTDSQKIFVYAGVGTASVTLKNDYSSMTIAPNTDHSVQMSGTGNLLETSVGYEGHFFDTTALLVQMGYRSLTIDNFKYSADVTTFSNTTAGQPVLKTDGTNRSVDFSGAFISLGLRFWIF